MAKNEKKKDFFTVFEKKMINISPKIKKKLKKRKFPKFSIYFVN